MANHLSDGKWTFPKHLRAIDAAIINAIHGHGPRIIIIEAPPRHGKSEYISKWFLAWLLSIWPRKRAILATYEGKFAASWGRKVRNIIEEHGHHLALSISKERRAASDWEIEGHGGGMVTAGVGGPLTGKGADVLVIDDIIKNAEDALSPTTRQSHWDWYQSVASTRLEPHGVTIVMMTRWHEDDLSGRLIAAAESGEGEPILRISLPAIATDGDWIGRKPGEVLWPERFSAEWMAKRQRALDEFWWLAMYQQQPTTHGAFEWPAEYWQAPLWISPAEWPSQFDLGAIAVDASKGRNARKGDFSANVFTGLSDQLLYVDADLARRPVEQLVAEGIDMAQKYATSLHAFGVEVNQFQELLIPVYEREMKARGLMPLPIYTIENQVNKKIRIGRLGPYFRGHCFRMLDTPGNRLLIEQCKTFSMRDISGVHDDGPDALEMSIRIMNELSGNSAAIERLHYQSA